MHKENQEEMTQPEANAAENSTEETQETATPSESEPESNGEEQVKIASITEDAEESVSADQQESTAKEPTNTDEEPAAESSPAETEVVAAPEAAAEPTPVETEAVAAPESAPEAAAAPDSEPGEPEKAAKAEPESEASAPESQKAESEENVTDAEPEVAAAPESEPKAERANADAAANADQENASDKNDDADNDDEGEDGSEEESFEALLEQYDQFRNYRPGDLVKGTVVSISDQEVLMDIGARVEGMVPATELKDEEGNFKVQDGETVTVMVCRYNPDSQYVPLSYERARVSRVWDHIEEVAGKERTLEGAVIEKVKGGFIVDVGVRAFLPTSQASLRPQKDLQDLLGAKMEFTILKIQRRRGNLILSRRELLQEELEHKKSDLFEKLVEGAVLQGVVKNIVDYGVFIDLGGLDGLLHITDMSWGRVTHPKDMVELGQEIEVKVLRFDQEKEKVSLGLKQCTADPWLSVHEKYPKGVSAKGKVLNLTSYGAFVEIEPGVEGMIHVSEMSWTKKVRNPAQILSKGQEVEARVLALDTENRRVSLSLKQNEDNPWDSLAVRFPVGSKVNGTVRNITDFGAFVEIEDGIDGLVHISDFSWGDRNADPNTFVKKGDEIEVVVLAVDTENHKVSLGIKQLSPDPWIEFTKKFKNDEVVKAPVSKITDFGVFLQLSDNVEGLIRNNEIQSAEKSSTADFTEGEEVQAIITRITHRDRKVDLSIRRLTQFHERQAIREYSKKSDTGGATMGDVMGDLKKFVE